MIEDYLLYSNVKKKILKRRMKNFSATSWNETLAKMNLKIFKDNINDVSIYMDA